jgi:medium-chain acyl-[acyl-carrier-protein] hydrolase
MSWPGDSWVVIPRPSPHASVRFFCFPYAGGGTTTFQVWADQLPSTIEVCLVRLPGRESRLFEQPYRQLSALLPVLTTALSPYLDPDSGRAFVLFGHSMGALIAFELARFLRRAQLREPVHVMVSGRPAPQLPVSPERLKMHELQDDQLLERLRKFSGTPKVLLDSPEMLRMFLPTLRADFSIVETYSYQPEEPLDCGISAFGGSRDPDVPPDAMAAWREQTRGVFTCRQHPGNHFYLQQDQGRKELLECIANDLSPFLE